jgi:hypothetical protein
MLFKTADGKCIEILRSYFTNDTAYYNMILSVKGCSTKDCSTKDCSAKVNHHSESNHIDDNYHTDNCHNEVNVRVSELERIKSIMIRKT